MSGPVVSRGGIDVLRRQIEEGAEALRSERDKAREARYLPHGKFTNWSHIGHCNPTIHHRPRTEEEVVSIIRGLNVTKGKARVAGAGASPSRICFTNDAMLHMKEHLNKVVSVSREAKTITVQGGCTLRHVYATLDAAGLMLACVPSFLDVTIAGALATGTHSSGPNVGPLHTYAKSMRVVTGGGEVRVIDKDATPEEWRHWACHLGVLGVVTEVTLQAERKALWRRISAPLSTHQLHSVLAQRLAENEFYSFLWTPHTDMCYETTIRQVAGADDEESTCIDANKELEPPGRHVSGDASLRIGDAHLDKNDVSTIMRALRDPHSSHRMWDQHQSEQQLIADAANRLLPEPVNPVAVQHTVLERALYAATFTPGLQPSINQAYQKAYLAAPQEQYGIAGEVMATDCLLRQHSAEWAVDASLALEALEATRRVVASNGFKVHFPVSFRFAAADDTTLSPCKGRKTCFVSVVMYRPLGREAPDTPKYLETFSREMARIGGRPHWGKYFSVTQKDMVKNWYGSEWLTFNQYRNKCDPNNIFVNEWYSDLLNA